MVQLSIFWIPMKMCDSDACRPLQGETLDAVFQGRLRIIQPEKGYRCTRFTLSEPYLLGANMNIHDLSQAGQLIYAGPTLDVLECVGGFVSNGRLFYTTNGGGLQSCLAYGPQAAALTVCWE